MARVHLVYREQNREAHPSGETLVTYNSFEEALSQGSHDLDTGQGHPTAIRDLDGNELADAKVLRSARDERRQRSKDAREQIDQWRREGLVL